MTSTRTTVRASSFSARRWAAVAPTLPAPTTVILFSMGGKATDSFPLSTTWRGGQGVRSAAPRVHLPVRVRAQGLDPVQRAPVGHAEPLLGAAVPATLPGLPNQRRQLRVRRPTAQRIPQIGPVLRVQAEQPGAVRRHPAAVAA